MSDPVLARPDRKGARAIATAARAFRADVLAQKAAIEQGVLRLERDPVCDDAIRHVPIEDGPFGAATGLLLTYSIEAQAQPIAGAALEYTRRLDRIRLRDRVLRSGRAALRRQVRPFATLQPAPADICARLDAWRRDGYPVAGAPEIQDPGLDAVLAASDLKTQKKLERAARRLRQLGASRYVVKLFRGGDVLYDGIDLGDPSLHIGEASRPST